MRYLFTIAFIAVFSQSSFCQLTKSETIKYINSKLEETKSLALHYNDERTYTMTNLFFRESTAHKDKIAFSYTRTFGNGDTDHLEYIFNPTHITNVGAPNDTWRSDPVSVMLIQLIGKTLVIKQTRSSGLTYINTDKFLIPFLRTDSLNAERVQKALLHLKKLYQDERRVDPFVN